MARRLRIAMVGAAVLAVAGCSSTVAGAGRGSAAAVGTPATRTGPPATSTVPTPPASSTASVSSSPTITPSGTTTAPASPLERDVASTVIGDPVTTDFCLGQGTAMLKPVGFTVQYSPVQYLGGCTWRLLRHGTKVIDVTEYANPAATAQPHTGGTHTRVAGLPVNRQPLDTANGICTRYVSARGLTVDVEGYAIAISHTSPDICKAADRLTAATAGLLTSPDPLRLGLPADNAARLDMCKVALAAGVTSAAPLAGATANRFSYGADCQLRNSTVLAYIDTAVVRPGATALHTHLAAGGHDLLVSDNNDKGYCSYSVLQGTLANGIDRESIEFSINAQNVQHPPAHMCANSVPMITKFLDTAGLR